MIRQSRSLPAALANASQSAQNVGINLNTRNHFQEIQWVADYSCTLDLRIRVSNIGHAYAGKTDINNENFRPSLWLRPAWHPFCFRRFDELAVTALGERDYFSI
jgi:hypothetical protein